jgi:hypothetical protein
MSTIVKIIGTGTEMEIDPELVDKKDKYETLKRALGMIAQGMQNAKITETQEGENTIVTVQPKLAGKGYGPIDYLKECHEQRNPMISMFINLKSSGLTISSHDMYNLGMEAKAALKQGEEWIEQIAAAEKILLATRPTGSSIVQPG